MSSPGLGGLVTEILPTVVELRRGFHRHPELAHQEYRTTEVVAGVLREAGLSPRTRTPHTGLTVEVGSGERIIGFRADLDALPIQEPDGLPFRSELPGVMHACGHDLHAALAVGLALLVDRLPALPGRVRFIFQPAEETFPGGALEMVREGAADGLEAVVAFHVDPALEPGRLGLRSGAITGSADRFYITLEGPGGHTARPHRTVDLIYVAGQVITQLPALLDRLTDARSPMTLVFGKALAGTAENVIPTTAELSGTCRTLDHALWEELPALLDRLVHDIVAPSGAKVLVHYQRGIPPVVNDERVTARCRQAIASALGLEAVTVAPTSMGAEDFARFTEAVPGCLMRLGVKPPGPEVDLHAASFVADESALETGLRAGLAVLAGLLET
ncbi:MAG TPA: amidohydrolase [Acidimicrobiia bacterium]|nr:amidohydrolase [Acidimicrobiia bacterium]